MPLPLVAPVHAGNVLSVCQGVAASSCRARWASNPRHDVRACPRRALIRRAHALEQVAPLDDVVATIWMTSPSRCTVPVNPTIAIVIMTLRREPFEPLNPVSDPTRVCNVDRKDTLRRTRFLADEDNTSVLIWSTLQTRSKPA